MIILILGTSGRLGSSLYKTLKADHKIYHTGLKKRNFDITNFKKLERLIKKTNPKLIINCIANTDIDFCEKYKSKSNLININIVKNLALIKKKLNINYKLLHFSTDHMYDNKKVKNKENSENIINNHYTKQKIRSEKIALDINAIVFRINFFGFSESRYETFTGWLISKLKKKEKLTLFDNVNFNPISLKTLCIIINKLIKNKSFFSINGIYNLGSRNSITKKNFALKFLAKKNFEYSSARVENVCTVKRSKFMQMNVSKFEKKFNLKLPLVENEIIKEKKIYEKI
tara:strand:+ start:106 stop:963 length:858 start_codon:yes stop_codon:yes gene_type:complete